MRSLPCSERARHLALVGVLFVRLGEAQVPEVHPEVGVLGVPAHVGQRPRDQPERSLRVVYAAAPKPTTNRPVAAADSTSTWGSELV